MGMKPSSRRYKNRPKEYVDWTRYDPHPPDISKVELSNFVEAALPDIGEKTHMAWMKQFKKTMDVKVRFSVVTPAQGLAELNENPKYNAWCDLGQSYKAPYINDARRHLQAMQYMGYELDEIYQGDVVDPSVQGLLSVEAAEAAAKMLHACWCREQLDKGWVYGPEFNMFPDKGPLTSPDLVQYEYLGGCDPNETDYERIKAAEKTRDIRQSVWFQPVMDTLNYAMGSGNFQIIRSDDFEKPVEKKPRSSADLDRVMQGFETPSFGSYSFGEDF